MNTQRVLNGRYELGELIGRGGMADVHRGVDTRLGRTVAIKLLRPDLARDPQFQARFKREAQAVAALNHPSIVAIYDTGDHAVPGGPEDTVRVPYIVMEFVYGKTLRDLIRAKEVSIDHAIDFSLGVLSALEYSHRAGIVHRDIKPANVMFCDNSDTIKVMDFGIARAMADSSATMTQTQAVVGTAQYLSPEQARGETVDARSDLYSAACLLYEMLTGRPPFVGDSPVSVAYQHVREIPEPASSLNPEVSAALDSVLAKALQKNRADRFQDAAAFQRALRAARNGIAVPDVAAGEAPTDPNNTVPAAERTARTEPYSVTGASFLDDSPSGRLRPVQDTLGDDRALPAQVYEPLGSQRTSPGPSAGTRADPAAEVPPSYLDCHPGDLHPAGPGRGWPLAVQHDEPAAPSGAQDGGSVGIGAHRVRGVAATLQCQAPPADQRLPHDTIPKGTAIGTVRRPEHRWIPMPR